MYRLINVARQTQLEIPNKNKKKVNLNVTKQNPDTLIMYNNDKGGVAITADKKGNYQVGYGGNLFVYAFLKPYYDSNTGECLIGRNTSNDTEHDSYSAQLLISFSDSGTAPAGSKAPKLTGTGHFCWTTYLNRQNISKDWVLNLNELANGKKYCHIKVKTDRDEALIEGQVYVTIAPRENFPNVIKDTSFTISTSKPIDDGGSKIEDVVNSDIFFALSEDSPTFLLTMVGVTKGKNKEYKFTVGDPRDDAVIETSEV